MLLSLLFAIFIHGIKMVGNTRVLIEVERDLFGLGVLGGCGLEKLYICVIFVKRDSEL